MNNSSETLEVILKITAGGDASSKLDELAKGTKKLSEAEQSYQQMMEKRLGIISRLQKAHEDLNKTAMPGSSSADEARHNREIESRIRLLEREKRLRDDISRSVNGRGGSAAGPGGVAGAGPGGRAMSKEEEFRQAFERKLYQSEKQAFVKQKMIETGNMEDPEIVQMERERKKALQTKEREAKRAESEAERERQKAAERQRNDRNKQAEYGEQKNMKTFLAMIAGRPVEAGISAMIPGGAGHAAKANVAMAVAMAVPMVMTKMSEITNIQNNSSMTGVERERGIGRALGFGFLIDFADAVDGTTERVRRLTEILHPQAMARLEGESMAYQVGYPVRQEERSLVQRAGIMNRLMGSGEAAAYNYRQVDRSTVGGEREYEREQLRYQYSINKERAKSALEASRGDFARAGAAVRDRESEASQARMRERYFAGRAKFATSKEERVEFLQKTELAQAEILQREAELRQRIQEYKEKGVQTAQAESQLRQASINHQKEELNLLKEKESRIASSVRTLGGMNEGDYQSSLAALKEIQKTGRVDSVPPQMLANARQIAREYIGKLEDQLGEERRQRDGIGIIEGDPETLSAVRAEVQKMNATVNVAISIDEQSMANRLAEYINGLADRLEVSARRASDARNRAIETGNQLRNASQQ